MKMSSFSRYAAVATVAAILAGCGGHSIVPQIETQAVPSVDRNAGDGASQNYIQNNGMLNGEEFSSTKFSDTCQTGRYGDSLHFKASGKASGPFRGRFTARGTINNGRVTSFSEKFTIFFGSKKIPGEAFNIGFGGKFRCHRDGEHKVPFSAHGIYKLEAAKHWNNHNRTSLSSKGASLIQTFQQ